ncbi:MAG: hypothetical protein OET79_11505 [Nitrospirota bacterium]|nr:hypothetical protein [Nitrospirota bacterium]
MKELGEALKVIFQKIGDFFDVLDLSFFIAGLATLGALYVAGRSCAQPFDPDLTGTVGLASVVLASYIAGLICFALGRWVRMWVWPKLQAVVRSESKQIRATQFEDLIETTLTTHGLNDCEPFKSYLLQREKSGIWRLYVRLWAEIRHATGKEVSLTLLKRYWVMAATYDGVAVSALVWGVVALATSANGDCAQAFHPAAGLMVFLATVGAAVLCLREAGRYVRYQNEELVATIAAARDPILRGVDDKGNNNDP